MTAETIQTDRIPEELRPVMQAMAEAGARLAAIIRRGGDLASPVGTNADGDGQKALDVMADDLFRQALAGAGVRWLASEEQDEAVALDPAGRLAVAIDPLDGSSNIDTNVSIGTIFSIYPAEATAEASFLRPARQQIAGGYIIYGPRCAMMVTFGDGVQHYALDPDSDGFRLVTARQEMPESALEFAINASNYRHWPQPIRAYIDDCLAGSDGPRKKNFAMRWLASLVAEAHRILMHGGVFLQPGGDVRNAASRLRLVHDCAPIALLIEAAGGSATDLCEPVLGLRPAGLDQRIPFAFGSTEKVARIAAYHDLPEPEVSALFGHRGLFRA